MGEEAAKEKEHSTETGSSKDVEQTAAAVAEEAVEEAPASAPSGAQADSKSVPSEAGAGGLEKAPEKEKTQGRHRLQKSDPLYEAKKRRYRAGHIKRKYESFKTKYQAADEKERVELEKELKKDQSEIAENYAYCSELKNEAEERGAEDGEKKKELAAKIFDYTREAMENIGKCSIVVADQKMSSEILPVHDEAGAALESVKQDRAKYATVTGNAELEVFLNKIMTKRKAIAPRKELIEATEKMALLDGVLSELQAQYDALVSEMGPEKADRAKKLTKKREKLQAQSEALNKKYNEKSPIVRLIRHAVKISQTSGQVKEEAADKVEIVDEHIMGSAMDAGDEIAGMLNENKEEETSAADVMGKATAKGVKAAISALQGKISLEQAEKIDSSCSAVFSFLQPAWKCYMAVRNIRTYFKETKDLSPDEKEAKQEDIIGCSFDALASMVEPILSVAGAASAFPLIGSLLGFVGDAVSAILQISKWDRNALHRDSAIKSKNETKKKMVEKRRKYGADADLRPEGLLSSVGETIEVKGKSAERFVHIQKNASKRNKKRLPVDKISKTIEQEEGELNAAVGGVSTKDMYQRMAELKKKKMESDEGLSADEKKEYYKMKALKMQRDYKEEKETIYVNKKRIRQGVGELIHIALNVAKNIAGLCPGLGSLIGQIIGLTNVGSKYLHKAVTFFKQKGRNRGLWGDGTKTTAAKSAKRSSMAENLYGQMLFVGGYMKSDPEEEPKGTFQSLDVDSGGQVAERMTHLDKGTKSLGLQFSKMYVAQNRETLLSMMASAFSTQG